MHFVGRKASSWKYGSVQRLTYFVVPAIIKASAPSQRSRFGVLRQSREASEGP